MQNSQGQPMTILPFSSTLPWHFSSKLNLHSLYIDTEMFCEFSIYLVLQGNGKIGSNAPKD